MSDETQAVHVETAAGWARRAVSFDGRRGELGRLLLRNLLLTVATLGVYRFWAKTRVRAFLWRNVKLLGEPLEYLGTGSELLIGFLIAIVVLTPLTAVFSLLPYVLPDGTSYGGLVLQALYYTFLWFLFQVAVYRVRRYRLTRTAWRGVRFGLDGSSFRYALIWFLYAFVTVATLGLAYPWFRVATTRYVAGHARFGSTAVSFDASARRLFWRWLVVLAPTLAGLLLFVAVNGDLFELLIATFWTLLERLDDQSEQAFLHAATAVDYRPLWLVPLGLVLRTWYRVNEFRYLLSSVGVGEVRLDSGLRTAVIYLLQYVFYFGVVATAVFLWVVAAVVFFANLDEGGLMDEDVVAGFAVVLAAVVTYLLYGFARKLFVEVTLLKLVCATLGLERPEALERTVQSTASLPAHGEGLADALDMGGF